MNTMFHNKLQCYIQWMSSNLLSFNYNFFFLIKKSVENADLKIYTQSSVTYKLALKHNALLGCSNIRVVWGNNFCMTIFITILRWLTVSSKKDNNKLLWKWLCTTYKTTSSSCGKNCKKWLSSCGKNCKKWCGQHENKMPTCYVHHSRFLVQLIGAQQQYLALLSLREYFPSVKRIRFY